MSSQTMEQSLEAIVRMLRGNGTALSRLAFASNSRYQLALNPTLAGQLAEAGFSKKSLAKYLYEKTCITWEQLNPGEKEAIRTAARSGIAPGVRPEDCKPGLVFPAFSDPKFLAILVAGDPGGNTVLWISPVGSTSINPDVDSSVRDNPRAFMTKKIMGATLTRSGR